MFWDWWQSLFVDMTSTNFFNFSFLPKYGYAVIQGVEYTLILSFCNFRAYGGAAGTFTGNHEAQQKQGNQMYIRRIYCGFQVHTDTCPADDNILWSVFIHNRTEVYDIRIYRFLKIYTGGGGSGT